MKIFCERFKDLRMEKEMTYSQLAKALNVSDIAVARWEKGERVPNIDYLYQIALFFKVSADYLLGLEN